MRKTEIGSPKFLLILFAFIFLLQGCGHTPSSRRKERVMGALNELIVVGAGPAERSAALDGAFEILREIDRRMSVYREDSEISILNAKAATAPVPVSQDTFDLLRRAVEFSLESEGAFDITVFPLVKLWGFYEGNFSIPSEEAIHTALSHVGSEGLLLDPENREVRFRTPGMGVDVGALGKGHACDKVVAFLKAQGIPSALVNIGGTIYAYGKSPEGRPWRVGLRHPRDPSRTLKVIPLEDEAVSTSGDYEQFFVRDGKRYAHIVDPRTGYPVTASVAVSVTAPSALLADALSTAFFVLGPDRAHQLGKQYPEVDWQITYFEAGERFKTITSESV